MQIDELIATRSQKATKAYQNSIAMRPERWASFGYQIRLVSNLCPNNILEIGKGNGLFEKTMTHFGHDIETIDIDGTYEPTYVGDNRSFNFTKKYDLVAAFQILQHIPYVSLGPTIKKICAISKKNIVVSVPFYTPHYLSIKIVLPRALSRLKIKIKHDFIFRMPVPFSKERKYADQNSSQAHYWELGRAGRKEKDFVKLFEENAFKLEHSFTCVDHPYHRYIVFSKEN